MVEAISSYNAFELVENVIYIQGYYLDQAETLIYRINVYDQLPEFVVLTSDWPNWLLETLGSLGNVTRKRTVTNAVYRIFTGVDHEYFHNNGYLKHLKCSD
jgi:hypothetical protein